jgi:hypothetical protein
MSQKCPYNVVAVAVVRNEAIYIAEWLEFHLHVGVECFFLYDNNSTDGLPCVLWPYRLSGIVNYMWWPGIAVQLACYQYALNSLRQVALWVAFIDVDEFIVPVTSNTVCDFLKQFDGCGGVTLSWLVYGSGGQLNHTGGMVIERFQDYAPPEFRWNGIVKSIVNPRLTLTMSYHEANYVHGYQSCDTDHHLNSGWVPWENRRRLHDRMRINHYFAKSYQEFLQKIKRGRADRTDVRTSDEWQPFATPFGNRDGLMNRHILVVKNSLILRLKGVEAGIGCSN